MYAQVNYHICFFCNIPFFSLILPKLFVVIQCTNNMLNRQTSTTTFPAVYSSQHTFHLFRFPFSFNLQSNNKIPNRRTKNNLYVQIFLVINLANAFPLSPDSSCIQSTHDASNRMSLELEAAGTEVRTRVAISNAANTTKPGRLMAGGGLGPGGASGRAHALYKLPSYKADCLPSSQPFPDLVRGPPLPQSSPTRVSSNLPL